MAEFDKFGGLEMPLSNYEEFGNMAVAFLKLQPIQLFCFVCMATGDYSKPRIVWGHCVVLGGVENMQSAPLFLTNSLC